MENTTITDLHNSGNSNDADMFLTFWVSEQLFGIPITNVEQIIGIQNITEIPDSPYYAKGIINLRGTVIPVIEIRLRFGKPEAEYTDRTCIIVVNISGQDFGFIVDSVKEVVTIDGSKLSPPPNLASGGASNYLSGVARMDEGMVLLLDITKLLPESDFAALSNLSY